MRKEPVILVLLFALAQSASAAIIDHGTYLTDTTSGLDWLKLTETRDRSYQDIYSQLGGGGEFSGWQYANGAQFESLLFGQGVVADTGCQTGINFCGGGAANNSVAINGLVNAIGDSFELATTGNLTSAAYASVGILADTGDSPATHYAGLLVGSYLSDNPYARTHYGDARDDKIHEVHIGSFLVRVSEVPVPAAAYLFGSGLLGLIGSRRLRRTSAN